MFFLFAGTLLIGVGIAILNVLLPVIVKDKFPGKAPLMTSVYSTSMSVMASLASGVSIPLAVGLNLGWKCYVNHMGNSCGFSDNRLALCA